MTDSFQSYFQGFCSGDCLVMLERSGIEKDFALYAALSTGLLSKFSDLDT